MSDLTDRRREILRRRLRAKNLADDSAAMRRIGPRRDSGRAPLSFAQRRMWLHQQVNPGSSAYNVSIELTFHGHVDRAALEAALAGVVAAQELLRTTYHTDEDGVPYQRIHPALPAPTRYVEAAAGQVAKLAEAEAAGPFDLETGGPIRFLLIELPDGELVLVLTVHHIIWDGGSFAALCHSLTELYEQALRGEPPLASPLPVQYADFAEWEQRTWSEDAHSRELVFWRENLAPRPVLMALPKGDAGERAGRIDRRLPQECADGLRTLGTRTTAFTAFLACYVLMLHRYTARPRTSRSAPPR